MEVAEEATETEMEAVEEVQEAIGVTEIEITEEIETAEATAMNLLEAAVDSNQEVEAVAMD